MLTSMLEGRLEKLPLKPNKLMLTKKIQNRLARRRRIRARIAGTAERPRMSVYRSLRNISVQLIDDSAGKTIVAACLKDVKAKSNTEGAEKLGKEIAKRAKSKKIEKVVFDRGGYKYHGRIKALADSAREGGLVF
jgi:large subunit ribosomal protein L18